MLDRAATFRCIECGLTDGSPLFQFYYGDRDNGPAYWSDEGVLCSPRCSLAHHRKRLEAGSLPPAPAPEPWLRGSSARKR